MTSAELRHKLRSLSKDELIEELIGALVRVADLAAPQPAPVAQAQIDPFMEDYKRDTIAGLIEHCASVAETYSDQGRDGHQIAKAIRALATPSAQSNSGGGDAGTR